MLKKDGRVVPAQSGPQQTDRIFGVGGHRHAPARLMGKSHFAGDAVPRVTDFAIATRNTDHNRGGKPIIGAPAQGTAIVELLGRRIGIFAELNLRHRHQPGQRHADRPADDSLFGERGVKDPPFPVLFLQPKRCCVYPSLKADIFPKENHTVVKGQL